MRIANFQRKGKTGCQGIGERREVVAQSEVTGLIPGHGQRQGETGRITVWVGRTHNKQEQKTLSLSKYERADGRVTHRIRP